MCFNFFPASKLTPVTGRFRHYYHYHHSNNTIINSNTNNDDVIQVVISIPRIKEIIIWIISIENAVIYEINFIAIKQLVLEVYGLIIISPDILWCLTWLGFFRTKAMFWYYASTLESFFSNIILFGALDNVGLFCHKKEVCKRSQQLGSTLGFW